MRSSRRSCAASSASIPVVSSSRAAPVCAVDERRARGWRAPLVGAGDWVGFVVLARRRRDPRQRPSSATLAPLARRDAATTSDRMFELRPLGRRRADDRARRLPVVAGLRARRRRAARSGRPSVARVRGLFVAVGRRVRLYTAVKAAYLSTIFATRVEERNLIYLAPLLFVGDGARGSSGRVVRWVAARRRGRLRRLPVSRRRTSSDRHLVLRRARPRDPRSWATASSGSTPTRRDALLPRDLALRRAARGAALLARRRRRGGGRRAVAVAVGVLAWNLTGEISAATASNDVRALLVAYLPRRSTGSTARPAASRRLPRPERCRTRTGSGRSSSGTAR